MYISQIRKQILAGKGSVHRPDTHPELLSCLGATREERVRGLMHKLYPAVSHAQLSSHNTRWKLFEYIIDFWEHALISMPYMQEGKRGMNLARRPFLSPSVPLFEDSKFGYSEQYRWDTYFHNRGFLAIGAQEIVENHMLNFVDVFTEYNRIPNALSSYYLSHAQPPFEAFTASELGYQGYPHNEVMQSIMHMVEEELFTEWIDFGRGRQHDRQTQKMVEKYGLLTRHTNLHFHPVLMGCEDGKDHNWVTVSYGDQYLPVQLNAIIYGVISRLAGYYADKARGNDPERAHIYSDLKQAFHHEFQQRFWVEGGRWQGFRNYSTKSGQEGPILYGDLAAEVFPLFVGIATPEQAAVTRDNLARSYAGDYGLSITSRELRGGGSIPTEPAGQWLFQWEYPNCWAPIMLIAVEGLKRYGFVKEARDYQRRWVAHVEKEFARTGSFSEKYSYTSGQPVSEGFYGVVKGFGWTISTYIEFIKDLQSVSPSLRGTETTVTKQSPDG